MRAKDVISATRNPGTPLPEKCVEADMPVLDILPLLLDAPGRELAVKDDNNVTGVIDSASMLEGLGRLLTPRDDSSTIVVSCAAADYSASAIAHAVEDADAHLVDMLSRPAADGRLEVTLRVRHDDPSAAVHSLGRYGFDVIEASGAGYADARIAGERLAALQLFLGV